MEWLLGVLAVLAVAGGGAALVVRRVGPRHAAQVVDDGRARLEAEIATRTGGEATVDTELDPVTLLRELRAGRVPAGRVVVVGGRLPSGLRVRSAELQVPGDGGRPSWVAAISPAEVTRRLDVPGVALLAVGGRLRVAAGLASVGVRITVERGRVRIRIPAALPPFGGAVEQALTELVPTPPPGVRLESVEVAGGELLVRGQVDLLVLERLVAQLPRPDARGVARSALDGLRAGRRRDDA